MAESFHTTKEQTSVVCNMCDDSFDVKFKCLDCDLSVCEDAEKFIRKLKPFKIMKSLISRSYKLNGLEKRGHSPKMSSTRE